MENMDKFSFPKPPSPDTLTLLDLCFRAVAKDFSKYDHDALIAGICTYITCSKITTCKSVRRHEILLVIKRKMPLSTTNLSVFRNYLFVSLCVNNCN